MSQDAASDENFCTVIIDLVDPSFATPRIACVVCTSHLICEKDTPVDRNVVPSLVKLSLFEFTDDKQFENLDTFLTQIGGGNTIAFFVTAEASRNTALINLFQAHDVVPTYKNKSNFHGNDFWNRVDGKLTTDSISQIVTEAQRPGCIGCLQCLWSVSEFEQENATMTHYFRLMIRDLSQHLILDSAAAEAVNLLPKKSHPSVNGSLFGMLNQHCRTKMGSRLLDQWLRQPLLDIQSINNRLDIVEGFLSSTEHRLTMRDRCLKAMPDVAAILKKFQRKNCGLQELFRLFLFSRAIITLQETLLAMVADGFDLTDFHERFVSPVQAAVQSLSLYNQLVEHVIDMSQLPEFKVSPQHDEELQELHEEEAGLQKRASQLLKKVQDLFPTCSEIKLETSSQHGFYFRTAKADDERILRGGGGGGDHAVHILSILKNGVHFSTNALEAIADRYKAVQQEYEERQQAVVSAAIETASSYLPLFDKIGMIVAQLDVLQAFANHSALAIGTYTRPKLLSQGSGVLKVVQARHPCVELMDDMHFIPNDYELVRDDTHTNPSATGFILVTGPNMGGKSTYIRAIGSIVVLAQAGCFVPAETAQISIIDQIFARVGAGDMVQRGVSTFMAEMLESSTLLKRATKDSLIIIDELGRGTSTFDGFGIAWAISSYIMYELKSLCLFATHFHELTQLPGVKNQHVSAHVENGQVTMLYALQSGPCTQSYGVHVAKLAHFPSSVIYEAKRKADQLEHANEESVEERAAKHQRACQSLRDFDALVQRNLTPGEFKEQLFGMFATVEL